MLTRSDMDDLRAQIADTTDVTELRDLAVRLHGELEQARIAGDGQDTLTRILTCALDGVRGQRDTLQRAGETAVRQRDEARRERDDARAERDRARRGERDARLLLAGLVAASKATLAAFADDQPEAARAILGHELYAHGWEPAPGSHARQILADAAAAFHDAGLTEALHAAA